MRNEGWSEEQRRGRGGRNERWEREGRRAGVREGKTGGCEEIYKRKIWRRQEKWMGKKIRVSERNENKCM